MGTQLVKGKIAKCSEFINGLLQDLVLVH